MDLGRIRCEIPALGNSIYLNTGTYGPLPRVVAEEIVKVYRFIEEQGTFAKPVTDALYAGYEEAREKVAALWGVESDEVALTRNTSDGINIIASGLPWREGDEVIISDQEHSSGILPWLNLARRRGIRVKVLRLVNDGEAILSKLEGMIGPRTRLIFLSHVTCHTGLRLPVAQICRLAHDKGVLIISIARTLSCEPTGGIAGTACAC